MFSQVYGVDLRTISYRITKIFRDAELDKGLVIKEILITADDGKTYAINQSASYNLSLLKINNVFQKSRPSRTSSEN